MRLNLTLGLLALSIGFLACDDDSNDSWKVIAPEADVTESMVLNAGNLLEIGQNVTFRNGASLTMKGGSKIRFAGDYLLTISGSLVVGMDDKGTVHIEGNSGEPRGSLRISGDTLQAANLRIDGLANGMLADVDVASLVESEVMNCEIGVWLDRCEAQLSGLSIHDNEVGLRVETSTMTANGIVARQNDTAVYLVENHGELVDSEFIDNDTAILSEDFDASEVFRNSFSGNQYGLYYYYGEPELELNTFEDNRFSVFLSAYPRHDVNIKRNNFVSETDYAIVIVEREWNNPHSLDISENFWSAQYTVGLAERLIDGYDHSPCDTLVFHPISTQMFE